MPRTKQVRKKSSMMKKPKKNSNINFGGASNQTNIATVDDLSALLDDEYDSKEHFIKAVDTYYNKKLEELCVIHESRCELIKKTINDRYQDLSDYVKSLKVTDGEINNHLADPNKDPNVPTQKSNGRQSRSRKPVESFEFKKPKPPRAVSHTRSSSAHTAASATSASHDRFKTPEMSRMVPFSATITPKIYSDSPMSVMRRPQHGEMAISMSGSPLMVGAVSREDIPTVNVPMQDGRVFSIMPEPGAPPPDLPQFDEATRRYLQTLCQHLAILAPNTP